MSVKYPLIPLLYKKTGLQGITIFFIFLIQNIDCGSSFEPPRVPAINVLSKHVKNFDFYS